MRIAIIGNAGSGKSTLANWLATQVDGAARLDLDTLYWEPGQIAVARPIELASADLARFCANHASWVIEGCYTSLIEVALGFSPTLVFLDLDAEQCQHNCRQRPWEAHKFASAEQQDQHLPFLLNWVGDYYQRDGDMSHSSHQACFAAYGGPKLALRQRPQLHPAEAGIAELFAMNGAISL
ncbi:hypothetical protein [Chitinimonas sp.]|uniref:hypothetical protein n=1 Tax=Chitinimonas sp. TaxID=1934313 RepID=UPI0035AD81A0